MTYPLATCPICDTPTQDIINDRCDKCRWIIGIDDALNSDRQNLLINWSRRYYKSTVDYANELEQICKDEYKYKRLEDRLNRQRDDIDYIKEFIPQLSTSIEEIKSLLIAKDRIVLPDETPPVLVMNSSEDQKDNTSEIEEQKSIDLTDRSASLEHRQCLIPVEEEINSEDNQLTPAQQEIISDYYYKPREFAAKYQIRIANITKDSINANRGSEEKTVILEETNRGNYWIFNFGDNNYLVPVEDKYINQHSYTTTSTIFEGHNYTPDYQKIQLIKPAIVSIDPNTNPQTWRLQQQGELAFL
jgi:hypothetical protein